MQKYTTLLGNIEAESVANQLDAHGGKMSITEILSPLPDTPKVKVYGPNRVKLEIQKLVDDDYIKVEEGQLIATDLLISLGQERA